MEHTVGGLDMTSKALGRKIRAAGAVLALAALLPAVSFAQKSDYPSGAAIRGSAGHHGGTHGYFDPKPGTPDPVANRSEAGESGKPAGGGNKAVPLDKSDCRDASGKGCEAKAGGGTE